MELNNAARFLRRQSPFLPLFLFLFFFLPQTYSQWNHTQGPYDCNVNAFTADGNYLFAATGTGVAASTDNGLNWTFNNTGWNYFNFTNISCITSLNGVLFACEAYDSTIYKSSDKGITWIPCPLGVTGHIYSIGTFGSNVYACTNTGIYLSDSYGEYWGAVNQGLTNLIVKTFTAINNDILIGTDGGLFRSSNGGYQWAIVDSTPVTFLQVHDNKIYAGSRGNGIRLSTNNGASWNNIGPEGSSIHSLTVNLTNIAALTDSGIVKSDNNGSSWVSAGLKGITINNILYNNGILLAGANYSGGIYRSTDNGLSWYISNKGLTNLYISDLIASGDTLYASGDRGLISISTDKGMTWTMSNKGIPDVSIMLFAINGNYLYAAANNLSIYISSNRGADWYQSQTVLPSASYPQCFSFIDSSIYLGTNTGVFRSTDHGSTWYNTDTTFTRHVLSIIYYQNKILAASSDVGIYSSTNNGASWNTFYPSLNILSLKASGDLLYAATFAGLFDSKNNGVTFTKIFSVPSYPYLRDVQVRAPYIFTSLDKIYFSKDNGSTFGEVYDNTLYGMTPRSYLFTDSLFFIGTTSSGILYRPLKDMITSIGDESAGNISGYSLSQNYPNPFNPNTNISFSMPVKGNVKLTITNVLGQQVQVLNKGFIEAGNHSVAFDGSRLASGVYIYSLQVTPNNGQTFISSRKMILIK